LIASITVKTKDEGTGYTRLGGTGEMKQQDEENSSIMCLKIYKLLLRWDEYVINMGKGEMYVSFLVRQPQR